MMDSPVAKMMDSLYNKEGYRIKYGVFTEKVETKSKPTFAEYMELSEDMREARRAQASEDLVNIDSVREYFTAYEACHRRLNTK